MKALDIRDMDYSQFVGLIRERNRPSGGVKSIQEAAVNARISSDSSVLEIGSNTGFTSVNIHLLTGAEVAGVDINHDSVRESGVYAQEMGASGGVSFSQASATDLPFDDGVFDAVWCSNVASFISDRGAAIRECLRVLKPGGTLIVVPIYYRSTPPDDLVDEVSRAIGNKISVWSREFWDDEFYDAAGESNVAIEKYFERDYRYMDQSTRLDPYIDMLLNKPHLKKYSDSVRTAIDERARYFFELFHENNTKYAGFSVILFQKRTQRDEEELFLAEEV